MTLFSIGALQGTTTWLELGRNLLWTVPGNVLGGGLLVGIGYAWLAGQRPAVSGDADEATAPMSPLTAAAAEAS